MRKLVLFYGPPAVGKLTVSTVFAGQANAILFHNHLTYDIALSVFPPDSSFEKRKMFSCRLRLCALKLLFECDARDIVTTFCYEGGKDDWYIDALRVLCQNNQTVLYFVRLTAERGQLLDRVGNADRNQFGKVNSRTKLAEILQACDYAATIRSDNHLCLDTSTVTPDDASNALMRWVGLSPVDSIS